ncbi:MAG: cation diffusion facilitator family transporter [Planctomycetota bacterium]|nr:MAG: cation diffusion facilitator family transporter [Planctomycetota bacterium]
MAGHGADSSLKAVFVAVFVNALITLAKYAGWFVTASPALLAEAIHSTADVGNQVLLWIGIRQGQRVADEEHPYGWGPARYLWNLKSAMGIFFLGCGVTLYHGLHALFVGGEHEEIGHTAELVGLGILAGSLVLESLSLAVAYKEVRQAKGEQSWREFLWEGDDPTGVGVLLEDLMAVLGVLLALLGYGLSKLLHHPLPDALATVLIGLLLGWIAIYLARVNGRLLIGASVSKKQLQRIREALEADEIVERVVDLKTTILGHGRMRVKAEVDLYEKLMARRMREALKDDVRELDQGQDPAKVLVDVVGRTIRITGAEIERLERVIRSVAPTAVHIDLELI